MKKFFLILFLFLGMTIFSGCEDDMTQDSAAFEIVMPKYESNYCGNDMDLASIVEELKNLGFENIETIPLDPGSTGLQSTGVYSVNIFKNWLDGCVSFEKGDVFLSNAKVEIRYFDYSSVISAESDPELKEYLSRGDLTNSEFVAKYGGQIIMFEGYITGRTTDISGNLIRYSLTGAEYNPEVIDGIIFSTSIDSDWNIHHGLDRGEKMVIIGKVFGPDIETRKVVYITAYYIDEVEDVG